MLAQFRRYDSIANNAAAFFGFFKYFFNLLSIFNIRNADNVKFFACTNWLVVAFTTDSAVSPIESDTA